MHTHPLIHAELARQREPEFRRPRARKQRGPERRPRLPSSHRSSAPPSRAIGKPGSRSSRVSRRPCAASCAHRLERRRRRRRRPDRMGIRVAHIDCLREPEAFGSWLIVMARRAALRTLERGRREVPVVEPRFPDETDTRRPKVRCSRQSSTTLCTQPWSGSPTASASSCGRSFATPA